MCYTQSGICKNCLIRLGSCFQYHCLAPDQNLHPDGNPVQCRWFFISFLILYAYMEKFWMFAIYSEVWAICWLTESHQFLFESIFHQCNWKLRPYAPTWRQGTGEGELKVELIWISCSGKHNVAVNITQVLTKTKAQGPSIIKQSAGCYRETIFSMFIVH